MSKQPEQRELFDFPEPRTSKTVVVTADLHEELVRHSKRLGVTLATIVNEGLSRETQRLRAAESLGLDK